MHNHQCLWNIFKSRPSICSNMGACFHVERLLFAVQCDCVHPMSCTFCTVWLCTSMSCTMWFCTSHVVYTCTSHVSHVVYNVILGTNMHILMLWAIMKIIKSQQTISERLLFSIQCDFVHPMSCTCVHNLKILRRVQLFCTSHVVYSCTSHVMYNVILETNLHILIFWRHNENN